MADTAPQEGGLRAACIADWYPQVPAPFQVHPVRVQPVRRELWVEDIVLVSREGDIALGEVHIVLEADSSRDRGIGIALEEGSIDQPWEEVGNIPGHLEVVHILRTDKVVDLVSPVLRWYPTISK